MRGDRLIQLDMSLIKNFRITESKTVEFRAQVFNLTNTPSFAAPNGSVNLASRWDHHGDQESASLVRIRIEVQFLIA